MEQLENTVKDLNVSVDQILQNHFPHVIKEVGKNRIEMAGIKARVTILGSINLLALIVIALLAVLLR